MTLIISDYKFFKKETGNRDRSKLI